MTTLSGFAQFSGGPHKVIALNGWFGSSADWSALIPPSIDALATHSSTIAATGFRDDKDGEHSVRRSGPRRARARRTISAGSASAWSATRWAAWRCSGRCWRRPGASSEDGGVSRPFPRAGRAWTTRVSPYVCRRNRRRDRSARGIIASFRRATGSPHDGARTSPGNRARTSRREAFAAYLPHWATGDSLRTAWQAIHAGEALRGRARSGHHGGADGAHVARRGIRMRHPKPWPMPGITR